MIQSVNQEVFDGDELLRRMMGDRDLAIEIVTEFVSDISLQIANLKASITSGDEQIIARQIHTIKGASANVGAKALERLARGAEREGVARGKMQADAFVVALSEQLERFKSAVKDRGFFAGETPE